jgi:hypothetical protein
MMRCSPADLSELRDAVADALGAEGDCFCRTVQFK